MTSSIVVFATAYPPEQGASAMRARNLVKALRELGSSVTVFAPRSHEDEPPPRELVSVPWVDLERVGRRARLDRLTTAGRSLEDPDRLRENPFRLLARRVVVPDLYATWIVPAVFSSRRAVEKADTVLSTGAPSSHVVARLVAGDRTWVADVNDLWWNNPHQEHGAFRQWLDRHFERGIFDRADALTTVNEMMEKELSARFETPVTALYSGYEPDEFGPEAEGAIGDGHMDGNELVFAGTLYPAFDTGPIMEAVARGKREGWLASDALRIVFVGGGSWRAAFEARRHGVEDVVVAVPRMHRDKVLERLRRARALILPLYERDPYSLPMRFFEYVGSGRPILAVGPRDRLAARLVVENGFGSCASDADEVGQALRRLLSSDIALAHSPSPRERFSCREIAPRLQRLLADLQSAHVLLVLSMATSMAV